MDTLNRLTAVYKDNDLSVQEEITMFDDAAEEVRVEAEKKKTRTGHRRKFPLDILKFGYNKRIFLLGCNKTVQI